MSNPRRLVKLSSLSSFVLITSCSFSLRNLFRSALFQCVSFIYTAWILPLSSASSHIEDTLCICDNAYVNLKIHNICIYIHICL